MMWVSPVAEGSGPQTQDCLGREAAPEQIRRPP